MPSARPPLSRARVVAEAVALADEQGLAALSMRALAGRLGVEAMSLYHHVAGKEALLDAMVDDVFGEIHLPVVGGEWRAELRARSVSGRAVLLRHRWAVGLMDSRRTPGRGDPASPRRRARLPSGAGLLAGSGRHRVRPARRPPLRVHGAGGQPAVRGRGRPRRAGGRDPRAGGSCGLPALHRVRRGPRPAARGTRSATSSRWLSTWCSSARTLRGSTSSGRPRRRRPPRSRSASPCSASTPARPGGSESCSCRVRRDRGSSSRPTIADARRDGARRRHDRGGRHRHPDRVAGQDDPTGRRACAACPPGPGELGVHDPDPAGVPRRDRASRRMP